MNIVLWILQAALAFLFLSGGGFKLFKFEELSKDFTAIPHAAWRVLGALEIAGAVLLILPAAAQWLPHLTPIAALVLAIEALSLSALFARYSLKLTASNPLIWNVVMGLLAAFVAYGRFALAPVA